MKRRPESPADDDDGRMRMPSVGDPIVIIESVTEIKDEPGWQEYHLTVVYEDKRAFISLPVRTGSAAAEPSTKLCRQEIAGLATALRWLAKSVSGIAWEN